MSSFIIDQEYFMEYYYFKNSHYSLSKQWFTLVVAVFVA